MSSEFERQMAQTGSHLLINPFGVAILYYNGKEIADSGEATKHPIGTMDFKFLIRVNTNGTFDIQRRDGVNFNVTIETHHRIGQLQIQGDILSLPPWYTLTGDQLVQKFSLRPAEFKEGHFRVRLLNSMVFRRTDFRFLRSSWVTMIIKDDQMLKVCLQGERKLAILHTACSEIHARAAALGTNAENHGQIRFGLTEERLRQRSDSISTTASIDGNGNEPSRAGTPTRNTPTDRIEPVDPNAPSDPNMPSGSNAPTNPNALIQGLTTLDIAGERADEMPELVFSGDAQAIRNAYIQRLEGALADLRAGRKVELRDIAEQ